ncbi:MAG: RNA-binding protein [Candidatus Babeliales bacterium]
MDKVNNIYVGNISRDLDENGLREAFEQFGQVDSVSIIKDKFTGESRGFGFVQMADKESAQNAINGLNGTELKGRTVTVNEAKPRPERRPGGGFGGRSGGGRSSGGFGGQRRGGSSGGRGGFGGGNRW